MKTDTWDRVDDPDTNPHSYRHLIFDKVSQERNTGEKINKRHLENSGEKNEIPNLHKDWAQVD